MTARERVFKSLNHQEPDRIPYNARLCWELVEALKTEMSPGIDYREYFKEDIIFVDVPFTEYEKISFDNLLLPQKEAALAAADEVKKYKAEGLIVCNSYMPGIYEHIKAFFGDEEALVGMYDNPDDLMNKIEKVTEWLCKVYEMIALMDTDICWTGDDIGAQRSLIMSSDNYRNFYRPYHKELIGYIKKSNPKAKIAFHCCGHVTPIISDLIDVGVDILECVQPEAGNDLYFIKREYGKNITFWGAIGTQSVFFNRPPNEIKAEIIKSLEIMSDGGGYFAAPCHTLTNEVTVDAVKTFYETMINFSFIK